MKGIPKYSNFKNSFVQLVLKNLKLIFFIFQIIPYIAIIYLISWPEYLMTWQLKVEFFVSLFVVHVLVLVFSYMLNQIVILASFKSWPWVSEILICFLSPILIFVLIFVKCWFLLCFYVLLLFFTFWTYPRNRNVFKNIRFLSNIEIKLLATLKTFVNDREIVASHFQKELKVVSFFRNSQYLYVLLVFSSIFFCAPENILYGTVLISFSFFWLPAFIFDLLCVLFIGIFL